MSSSLRIVRKSSQLKQYTAKVQTRVPEVVQASADRVYNMAQSLTAVESGETRSKMRKEVSGNRYRVGFYKSDFPEGFVPLYLEFGTREMSAQPIIIPTAEAERPRFRQACKQALKP